MPYGKGSRSKKEYTSVQCTGLFKTQKKGLYVGSVTDEYFEKFVEKVKEAKKKERGVTFFLWRNDPDKGGDAAFTLYMDVDKPFKKKGKRIEEDDEQESTSPGEDDDDEEPEGDPFDD